MTTASCVLRMIRTAEYYKHKANLQYDFNGAYNDVMNGRQQCNVRLVYPGEDKPRGYGPAPVTLVVSLLAHEIRIRQAQACAGQSPCVSDAHI